MVKKSSPNIIVTAANKKFFRCLYQLLLSYVAQKENKLSDIVIYDLGMESSQLQILRKRFFSRYPEISLKKFNNDAYPDFVTSNLNIFAWKAQVIKEVAGIHRGCILWLDSGDIVLQSLERIWKEIEHQKVYAPIAGSGTLAEWTHKKTLELMHTPPEWNSFPNRSGNLFGFNSGDACALNIIESWSEFSLNYDCIQPEGANRSNHRWDQSILSILLYQSQANFGLKLTKDRVNISSGHPIKDISVRNKLGPDFPIHPERLSFFYFRMRRWGDIWLNRLKGQ